MPRRKPETPHVEKRQLIKPADQLLLAELDAILPEHLRGRATYTEKEIGEILHVSERSLQDMRRGQRPDRPARANPGPPFTKVARAVRYFGGLPLARYLFQPSIAKPPKRETQEAAQ